MASSSDNFKKMFLPEHPQLRLHVLLSILAFLVVVGSITFYQMHRVKEPEQVAVPVVDQNELTTEQRNEILSDLQDEAAKSPPLTDSQRNKIIEDLKKATAQQN